MKTFRKEDIVETISRYTDLKAQAGGKYYIGFCPLHDNVNTPALVVYPNGDPEESQWLCYGCHPEPDDVISFVMAIEGCSFPQALKICARTVTPTDALLAELGKPQRTDPDYLVFSLRAFALWDKHPVSVVQYVLQQLDELLDENRLQAADKWLAKFQV